MALPLSELTSLPVDWWLWRKWAGTNESPFSREKSGELMQAGAQ